MMIVIFSVVIKVLRLKHKDLWSEYKDKDLSLRTLFEDNNTGSLSAVNQIVHQIAFH